MLWNSVHRNYGKLPCPSSCINIDALEQPRGSALMKTPGMSKILMGTLWNEFDMCRVGDLKDPDTLMSRFASG